MNHKLLMNVTYLALLLFIYYINCINAAGLKNLKLAQPGLYTPADKVVILKNDNFAQLVLQQNRSSLVEFYNSYCGHCKRFAPTYKKMAERLNAWQKTIIIAAIDCAVEENNDICREYEIMGYPSIRYFKANFTPAAKNYGQDLNTQDPSEIRFKVSLWLAEEYSFLQPLKNEQAVKIANEPQPDLNTIIVFDYANKTTGIQVALHLRQYENLQVLHTESKQIASVFDLTTGNCILLIANRNKTKLSCLDLNNDDPMTYVKAIKEALIEQKIPLISNIPITQNSTATAITESAENEYIIKVVKQQAHTVYQADLEMAVHSMLFSEIPRVANISGERLLALKQMLSILDRYKPLSYQSNGNALISHMQHFVAEYNQQLTGEEFVDELYRMQKELGNPTFMANHYVGCVGTKPNYRGFTCSLWQLFHHLTVKAALDSAPNHSPDDVLKAIYGYVKYYFGCSDCSQHFQEMAARRNIWSVKTAEETVLWLWDAHNEVNERLKGDSTEDPNFPKILFPSETSCAKCYLTSDTNKKTFNRTAVLEFLQTIHSHANISQFGLETSGDGIIFSNSSSGERMRHKRMTMHVFSDLDMRFGILLYGFCITMILLAFKLFVFKKIRRVKSLADLTVRT